MTGPPADDPSSAAYRIFARMVLENEVQLVGDAPPNPTLASYR